MSGTPPPGTPPPEVPEEFAAAYRAAYLRALASQTDAPRHVADPGSLVEPAPSVEPVETPDPSSSVEPVDTHDPSSSVEPVETHDPPDDSWAHRLPQRVGRLVEGTHRREDGDDQPGPHERRPLTRQTWFVPLLLVLIVLAMVVGAYLLGRVVAATLGG